MLTGAKRAEKISQVFNFEVCAAANKESAKRIIDINLTLLEKGVREEIRKIPGMDDVSITLFAPRGDEPNRFDVAIEYRLADELTEAQIIDVVFDKLTEIGVGVEPRNITLETDSGTLSENLQIH